MDLPLLAYKPTTQNHRVASFGIADQNEDTPYIYRLEDATSYAEIREVIWACYRQVFSEHATLAFNRQVTLESQLVNRVITVRDFIRGLAKSERFYNTVVAVNNNYRLVDVCLRRFWGAVPTMKRKKLLGQLKSAPLASMALSMPSSTARNTPMPSVTLRYPTSASEWRDVLLTS